MWRAGIPLIFLHEVLNVKGYIGVAQGTILPLQGASPAPINRPGAFTVNLDGSVAVNQGGIYIADGRIQVAAESDAQFVG